MLRHLKSQGYREQQNLYLASRLCNGYHSFYCSVCCYFSINVRFDYNHEANQKMPSILFEKNLKNKLGNDNFIYILTN